MQEILARLKELGIRPTPQRQEIIQALLDRSEQGAQPLSAEDVLLRVRGHYPGVSLDTVYRTLAILKKSGLVNEVNFRDDCRRFELCLHGKHHHHLVCLGCGHYCEVPFCPVDLMSVQNCYPEFQIADHAFTIYGYCAKCAKQEKHGEHN
jgi:Fe2+ or Zn2+ uptake regulation protein